MLNAILKRSILSLVIVAILLPLTGCWDRREIENRGYVLGVGVDLAAPAEGTDINYTPQSVGERKYRITFELPKFRKETGSKEISTAQSHLIWSGEGESMFAVTRAVNTKTYFGMFFEDIQIMIFSEELARQGVSDVLDFFQRDAEMRRRVKLFVTPGRAEDVLKAKLQVEEVNSVFIGKLFQSVGKSPYFASKTEMGHISRATHAKRSFAMPIVIIEEKEVKVKGAAVFDQNAKMVGTLDELEVLGGKILNDNIKQGVIVAPNPADPNKIATFEIYEVKIDIQPVLKGENLEFKLNAKFTGTLGENAVHNQNALDQEFITKFEKAVAEQIERHIYQSYRKQQELKAEFCGLASLVHRRQPQYWKKVKDRWDGEVFPTVPLTAKVEVVVTRPVGMR